LSVTAIVLLGVPGSGKGTMAEAIKKSKGYIHIATGDMLREAIEEGTLFGSKAKSYMDKGDLVPDDVILKIVMDRLDKGSDNCKYMFDGFPRTLTQAKLLDMHFAQRNAKLVFVFLLVVPEEVTLARLMGRRVCRKCGASFHIRNIPPEKEGVCDYCGGELYQRPDDMKETILKRLVVFHQQTEELISYYEKKRILVRIDSSRHRNDSFSDVINVLQGKHNNRL